MNTFSVESIQNSEKNPWKMLDIWLFFNKNLKKCCTEYWYPKGTYEKFCNYCQPADLIEKIMDPERFFRILRSDTGKVVGYFESRRVYHPKTVFEEEVIQWIFIYEKFQWKWLSTKLWNEFFCHCEDRGIKYIKSHSRVSNHISTWMHLAHGFGIQRTDETKWEHIWCKRLR